MTTTVSIISTLVTSSVYAGTGSYAAHLTITAKGTVAPISGVGVYLEGTDSVINHGLIEQAGDNHGVALRDSAYLDNTGTIIGGPSNFAVYQYNARAKNTGTISDAKGDGVFMVGTSTFTNTGIIAGGANGLVTNGAATIVNAGTISGGTAGTISGGNGVILAQGVNFTNTGLITGHGFNTGQFVGQGVGVSSSGDNFTNSGTITGDLGISASGGVITNDGTVLGGTIRLDEGIRMQFASLTNNGIVSGYRALSERGGALTNNGAIIGIQIGLLGGGSDVITNHGTITGGQWGVYDYEFFTTLTNTGYISGQFLGVATGYKDVINNGGTIAGGLELREQSSAVNTGLIASAADGASMIVSTLTNAGTIIGSIGVDINVPRTSLGYPEGANAVSTLITSGYIGGATYAVLFENPFSYSTLVVQAGARFAGSVTSQPTTNTMVFAANPANAGETGSLGGFGTTVQGFATLDFAPAANFTIAGNVAGLAAGQLIRGFAKTDEIILDGFAVNKADTSYVSGIGLELTSKQGAQITLDVTGSYTTGNFVITSAGGDTRISLTGAPTGPTGPVSLTAPSTTIVSQIVTYAAVGTYGVIGGDGSFEFYVSSTPTEETISAALFGPASSSYTVQNQAFIQNRLRNHYAAAIVLGAAGTVQNAGTLAAANGIMDFAPTGTAYLENANAIIASFGIGIDLQGAGTAINTGAITADTAGIFITGGGQASNSGTINAQWGIVGAGASPLYVYNSGAINAPTGGGAPGYRGPVGNAVILFDDGEVTNAAPGSLTGLVGIKLNAGGTVVNDGFIQGTYTTIAHYYTGTPASYGIFLANGGAVYNDGFVSGTVAIGGYSAGVHIYNENYGQIIGAADGFGVLLRGGGTITNAGLIEAGAGGFGVYMEGFGTVTNSGVIDGPSDGVVMFGGTIFNTGTILGGIYFIYGGGIQNRLVLNPGAALQGELRLNGAALELQAEGSKKGIFALASLASNPGAVTIDSHAIWDLAGTLTLAPNATFTNNGTLKESTHDLLTIDGPVKGTGLIELSKQILTLGGSVAGSQKVEFSGTGETLALGDAASFHAKIEAFTLGDTIDLPNLSLSAITGTHFAKGILTLEGAAPIKLTFAAPSTFGSDHFLLTADGAGTALTLSKPKIQSPTLTAAQPTALPGLTLPPPITTTPGTPGNPSPSPATFTAGHIATYFPNPNFTNAPQPTLAN